MKEKKAVPAKVRQKRSATLTSAELLKKIAKEGILVTKEIMDEVGGNPKFWAVVAKSPSRLTKEAQSHGTDAMLSLWEKDSKVYGKLVSACKLNGALIGKSAEKIGRLSADDHWAIVKLLESDAVQAVFALEEAEKIAKKDRQMQTRKVFAAAVAAAFKGEEAEE